MHEIVSPLIILSACGLMLVGLMQFMASFAKSTNTEYQALLKKYENECKSHLDTRSSKDEWRLKAVRAADERDQATRLAQYWYKKSKTLQDEKTGPAPQRLVETTTYRHTEEELIETLDTELLLNGDQTN